MDDLVITSDEIIQSYEEETNFNKKKQPVKRKISIFNLHFYLIKYRAKQKHLLPFHFMNNELKEIIY